jgi:uncharacterized protein YcnI
VGAVKYYLVALLPLLLCGHATVSPGTSRPGAYERYVLRVPNESDNPTVRIAITFPPEVRVISFADVPGWQVQAVTDSTGRATSAVWTGSLPPQRFVEFPFIGVNPAAGTTLVWPVIQTYSNGQLAQWTGPRDSDSPASVTVIGAATSSSANRPTWIAGVALAVALGALLSARRRRPA